MKVSIHDVDHLFEQLQTGEVSREFASSWAYRAMQAMDDRAIVFEPADLEDQLWDAIDFLLGFDLQDSPSSYLHGTVDLLAARSKLRLAMKLE